MKRANLISVRDAAKEVGVTTVSIYNYINRRQLTTYDLDGRTAITRADLAKYQPIKGRKAAPEVIVERLEQDLNQLDQQYDLELTKMTEQKARLKEMRTTRNAVSRMLSSARDIQTHFDNQS